MVDWDYEKIKRSIPAIQSGNLAALRRRNKACRLSIIKQPYALLAKCAAFFLFQNAACHAACPAKPANEGGKLTGGVLLSGCKNGRCAGIRSV